MCADRLRTGEVDAGLVSSIEYLRIPRVKIVPGLCISSPKRVRSVVVLSRCPPEEIRSLALDTSSRTSVVLSQILLRERYGIYPEVVDMAPDQAAMLERCDATLMIGDVAMRSRREGLYVLDLAEEWHAWTGLPFVFALWIVREDAPALAGARRRAGPFFHKSLELGKQNLSTHHRRSLAHHRLDQAGTARVPHREHRLQPGRGRAGEPGPVLREGRGPWVRAGSEAAALPLTYHQGVT